MTVNLTLKTELDLPIEADTVTPSHFAGKSLEEIGKLPVLQGNQMLELKDFFDINGEAGETPDDTEIVVEGDLKKVKMIGKGMNGGKITVNGDVGMYLGAEMIAGRIHVKGSVDAWAAAEMVGGNIQIEGDAADRICAGYRGSLEGMMGGRVYVAGNVGREAASQMRKGFLAVKGNVGELAAAKMQGGTIVVCGNLAERPGVSAKKGMIIVLGKIDSLIPTYLPSGTSEREFTNYFIRYVKSRRPDFISEEIPSSEKWVKYMGDFAEGDPREEIYVRAKMMEHES
ncbi:MAG: formylmethanofuran dehydrogenase subunit C [Candidatus Thorarchaeota archaeon]|nr:formylmethanofuran dehydrogenase subunit C [Candidatus Thorarchaeota archaeon]